MMSMGKRRVEARERRRNGGDYLGYGEGGGGICLES
jgi:hypothetical protein